MTKVVKLNVMSPVLWTSWFMISDLQVNRRLRFRSFKLGIEEVYRITSVLDDSFDLRKSREAERCRDWIRMVKDGGGFKTSRANYLRVSVQWELLDD